MTRSDQEIGAKILRLFGFTAAVALSIALTGVRAQAGNAANSSASEPSMGWLMTVTGTGSFGPRYDGARRYGLSAIPSFSWRRQGEPDSFSAPDDSFDYTLWSAGRFSVGPVANLRLGRSSLDDSRLTGLKSVPWTIEPGIFLEYWPIENRLRTHLEIRRGVRGKDGFVGDLSLDWVEQAGKFTVSGGPRAEVADSRFMDLNFGISPTEAASNGSVSAYNPKAGLVSVGVEAALAYAWNDSWSTTVFGRYDRMVSGAAKSPIVDVLGSPDQFTLGFSVAHTFALPIGP